MPTLYVVEPGARIEKEYHRLLVTREDEVLLRVPLHRVTQVVLVGTVGVTTPALHALLRAQVPLLLVRRTGALVGRLTPAIPRNLPLRRAQYRRNDDASFCLEMTRAIVTGKLRNQRVLALRILRRRAGERSGGMPIIDRCGARRADQGQFSQQRGDRPASGGVHSEGQAPSEPLAAPVPRPGD